MADKNYKPHRLKSKEEKDIAKWEKKGQPHYHTEEMAVQQSLEQMTADFVDSMRSNGLIFLKFMGPDDILLLMTLCSDELQARGIGIRPVDPQADGDVKPGLLDQFGKEAK